MPANDVRDNLSTKHNNTAGNNLYAYTGELAIIAMLINNKKAF